MIATEQDPQARVDWREEIATHASRTLNFLDETSTQTVMTRSCGRAQRGERVVGRAPGNQRPNVTCLVALTPQGMRAPCVFEGALDGPFFARWVRDWLAPARSPGATVVLDNLRVHKNAEARAAIEAAGCRIHFLPAYPSNRSSPNSRIICAVSAPASSKPSWRRLGPDSIRSPTPTSRAFIATVAIRSRLLLANIHENRSRLR